MSGCLNYHKCNDMSYAREKYTKAMSKIMISVGTMVAKQIDELAHKQCPTYPKNKLQDVIRLGNAHVGSVRPGWHLRVLPPTRDDEDELQVHDAVSDTPD